MIQHSHDIAFCAHPDGSHTSRLETCSTPAVTFPATRAALPHPPRRTSPRPPFGFEIHPSFFRRDPDLVQRAPRRPLWPYRHQPPLLDRRILSANSSRCHNPRAMKSQKQHGRSGRNHGSFSNRGKNIHQACDPDTRQQVDELWEVKLPIADSEIKGLPCRILIVFKVLSGPSLSAIFLAKDKEATNERAKLAKDVHLKHFSERLQGARSMGEQELNSRESQSLTDCPRHESGLRIASVVLVRSCCGRQKGPKAVRHKRTSTANSKVQLASALDPSSPRTSLPLKAIDSEARQELCISRLLLLVPKSVEALHATPRKMGACIAAAKAAPHPRQLFLRLSHLSRLRRALR